MEVSGVTGRVPAGVVLTRAPTFQKRLYQHSRRTTASRVARPFRFLRRDSSVNSSQNGSTISEVRDFVATLSQVVVAVVSARLALFVFEVGFGYGETPGGMPVGSEIALDAILGVILLLGAGLGLALCRFPLYVMLSIPPLIRVFMLSPVQRELIMSLPSSARIRILSSLLAQRVVCFSAVGGGNEPQTEVGLEKCRRFCFSTPRLDAKGCLARVFDRTLRPLVTENHSSTRRCTIPIHKTPRRI